MLEIFHETDRLEGACLAAVELLKGEDPTSRYAIVRMAPDAATPGTPFGWIARMHHDLEGALRGMRFMAEKVGGAYDGADPKGKRVIATIARHLATLETLKTMFLDDVLSLDDESPRG